MGTNPIRFLQQENVRLKEQNETLRQENDALRGYMHALRELQRATEYITAEMNIYALLEDILHHAMTVLRAEGGSLSILDEEKDELVFVLVHGDISEALQDYRIKADEGIAGWVATNRRPLVVDNPRQDPRFSVSVDESFGFFTRSIICVPMIARDRVVGVIELVNKTDASTFNDNDTALLSILAGTAATTLMLLDAQEEEVKASS